MSSGILVVVLEVNSGVGLEENEKKLSSVDTIQTISGKLKNLIVFSIKIYTDDI